MVTEYSVMNMIPVCCIIGIYIARVSRETVRKQAAPYLHQLHFTGDVCRDQNRGEYSYVYFYLIGRYLR